MASEMQDVALSGVVAKELWGRILVWDNALAKAKWVYPVDAREGLSDGNEEHGPTFSPVIPDGARIPPHPEPMAPQAQPIVPAVQEQAGTVAASSPDKSIGATSPGPRVTRSTGGPQAPSGEGVGG